MTTREGQPVYTIRGGNNGNGYAIGVPREVGSLLPKGIRFAFRLTDTGFAYDRIVPTEADPGMPEWLHEYVVEE